MPLRLGPIIMSYDMINYQLLHASETSSHKCYSVVMLFLQRYQFGDYFVGSSFGLVGRTTASIQPRQIVYYGRKFEKTFFKTCSATNIATLHDTTRMCTKPCIMWRAAFTCSSKQVCSGVRDIKYWWILNQSRTAPQSNVSLNINIQVGLVQHFQKLQFGLSSFSINPLYRCRKYMVR